MFYASREVLGSHTERRMVLEARSLIPKICSSCLRAAICGLGVAGHVVIRQT